MPPQRTRDNYKTLLYLTTEFLVKEKTKISNRGILTPISMHLKDFDIVVNHSLCKTKKEKIEDLRNDLEMLTKDRFEGNWVLEIYPKSILKSFYAKYERNDQISLKYDQKILIKYAEELQRRDMDTISDPSQGFDPLRVSRTREDRQSPIQIETLTEGKFGYFRLYSRAKKTNLGKATSRPFLLFKFLSDVYNTKRTIESAFEALIPSERDREAILGNCTTIGERESEMRKRLAYTKKELQKKKLDRRLKFKIDGKYIVLEIN